MLKFLGIGAQKAGTTWLYDMLRRHPAIAFPGGKEVHFWDAQKARGLGWYTGLFTDPQLIEGDITPAYAMLPIEVVTQIREAFPELRLIYTIRNPLKRAWSSAKMALGRAELTHDEASDQWFIDHFRSKGSMMRGDYETCIRTWRAVFGEDRLILFLFGEIATSPRDVLERACLHIGADPSLIASIPTAELHQKSFAGDDVALRPSLMPVLQEIYGPRIASLSRLIGRDLQHWMRRS